MGSQMLMSIAYLKCTHCGKCASLSWQADSHRGMLESIADVDCCHDGAFELLAESTKHLEQINTERSKNERARNKANASAQLSNAT
jgi:hypothetical protein